jgi:hypothetical protein
MLGQLPEINRTIQGVGVLVGTQRPFVSFLVKNWPLALIAGFAMYARGRERWKQNEFNTYNLMADAGLILSPLVGLALLNQLAQDEQDRMAIATGQMTAPAAPAAPYTLPAALLPPAGP